MSITINGSGTITGISVGGLPDGIVDTDMLDDNAVTFGKIGTTEQGQLCKAWVNFDGTGTPSIGAAYNVSSITDNGVADYTVNFTAAMVDTNYSICGAAGLNTTSLKVVCQPVNLSPPATASVRIQVPNADGVMVSDSPYISVAVFR